MIVSIIVAAADNGVIGKAGTLPWRMPSDLRRFRSLTMGKPVVMGRLTFQSLSRPLDGRDNIVITRDRGFSVDGASVAGSLSDAIAIGRRHAIARGVDEIMIIGGGQVYAEALAHAGRVYLTRVHAAVDGDTTFPALPAEAWRLVREERLPRSEKDDYEATLMVYERRGAA